MMISYFIFFYVIGAFVFFCNISIITIKVTEKLSSQMYLKDKEKERLFTNYFARILFQTVMMAIFPVSFWGYDLICTYYKESLIVSSGLFTVIWLVITGILIKAVYYFITQKIKAIKVFDCDKFFENKEFFWIMCPLLYGVLFSLYDKTIFVTVLAIVLGKYIWMDSIQMISPLDIKIKVIGLLKKFKIDIHLLFCQALVMGYLLVRWYPIKDEAMNSEYIGNILLVLALFIMPMLDLVIFVSMKSYARFLKE